MTLETKERIHRIYSIALSVMLAVAGICLMVACVGIYNAGDRPFSREAVAAAFSTIAVPVYLCVALVIGGFILDGFFPGKKKKPAIEKQYDVILARLHAKTDLSQCDGSLRTAIKAQQKSRKLHKLISLMLLVLGSAIFLGYGLNGNHFHQSDINGSMVKAMTVFLPCLAVPFGYAVFAAYFSRASMQKEIELVKQAAGSTPSPAQPPKSCGRQLLTVRCVLLCVGIALLVYGFFAGGTNDVLTKAINICTECVGLG